MLVPCEIAIKCVLPVVRAMLAKELMAKHELKQMEVAKLLGISQPAVSLYYRKMRGRAIDIENESDVKIMIENLAESLTKGNLSHKEFIPIFCGICRTIRAKGFICKLHRTFDPTIDIEKCELCTVIATRCI